MKLKQYLTEAQGYNPHREDAMKGIQAVYTHCMPFIKELIKDGYNFTKDGDKLMLSGRNESKSIITKFIRKDRKPSDMDEDLYKMYDELFYDRFKIKGRSNALFCTGDYHTAGGYGANVYIIFPAGKYKYLWSDEVRDLYKNPYSDQIIERGLAEYINYRIKQLDRSNPVDLDKRLKELPPNGLELPRNHKAIKGLYKDLDKHIISTYRTTDLLKGLWSGHEMMVSSKYYIGLKAIDFKNNIGYYIEKKGTTYPTEEVFTEFWDTYF